MKKLGKSLWKGVRLALAVPTDAELKSSHASRTSTSSTRSDSIARSSAHHSAPMGLVSVVSANFVAADPEREAARRDSKARKSRESRESARPSTSDVAGSEGMRGTWKRKRMSSMDIQCRGLGEGESSGVGGERRSENAGDGRRKGDGGTEAGTQITVFPRNQLVDFGSEFGRTS